MEITEKNVLKEKCENKDCVFSFFFSYFCFLVLFCFTNNQKKKKSLNQIYSIANQTFWFEMVKICKICPYFQLLIEICGIL